jgi:hypothetical protein
MDDIVGSLWGELFTRCTRYTQDITSIFDRHDLRAETDSEIWDFVHSRISRCLDHPLGSTSAESSWNTDPIEVLENSSTRFLYILCIDELEFYFFRVSKSGTLESLIDRVVCILEIGIFANHPNREDICRVLDTRYELFPF